MNSTMEILARISNNSQNNPEEVFTRIYRYMLREEYQHIKTVQTQKNAAIQRQLKRQRLR